MRQRWPSLAICRRLLRDHLCHRGLSSDTRLHFNGLLCRPLLACLRNSAAGRLLLRSAAVAGWRCGVHTAVALRSDLTSAAGDLDRSTRVALYS